MTVEVDDNDLIEKAVRKYHRAVARNHWVVDLPCAARSSVEGDRIVLRNVREVMAIYRVRTRLEELAVVVEELAVVVEDGSGDL